MGMIYGVKTRGIERVIMLNEEYNKEFQEILQLLKAIQSRAELRELLHKQITQLTKDNRLDSIRIEEIETLYPKIYETV